MSFRAMRQELQVTLSKTHGFCVHAQQTGLEDLLQDVLPKLDPVQSD